MPGFSGAEAHNSIVVGGKANLDEDEYRRWREEADRALSSARVQMAAGLHNWSCFAAEQAAQLGAKALLHGLGRGPWGHDLARLGIMLQEAGVDLSDEDGDRMRRLGRHYIPTRYPDAHPSGQAGEHYGAADSEEALADAEAVLALVDSAWERLHG
jgi:HEPN domain-containing protein